MDIIGPILGVVLLFATVGFLMRFVLKWTIGGGKECAYCGGYFKHKGAGCPNSIFNWNSNRFDEFQRGEAAGAANVEVTSKRSFTFNMGWHQAREAIESARWYARDRLKIPYRSDPVIVWQRVGNGSYQAWFETCPAKVSSGRTHIEAIGDLVFKHRVAVGVAVREQPSEAIA